MGDALRLDSGRGATPLPCSCHDDLSRSMNRGPARSTNVAHRRRSADLRLPTLRYLRVDGQHTAPRRRSSRTRLCAAAPATSPHAPSRGSGSCAPTSLSGRDCPRVSRGTLRNGDGGRLRQCLPGSQPGMACVPVRGPQPWVTSHPTTTPGMTTSRCRPMQVANASLAFPRPLLPTPPERMPDHRTASTPHSQVAGRADMAMIGADPFSAPTSTWPVRMHAVRSAHRSRASSARSRAPAFAGIQPHTCSPHVCARPGAYWPAGVGRPHAIPAPPDQGSRSDAGPPSHPVRWSIPRDAYRRPCGGTARRAPPLFRWAPLHPRSALPASITRLPPPPPRVRLCSHEPPPPPRSAAGPGAARDTYDDELQEQEAPFPAIARHANRHVIAHHSQRPPVLRESPAGLRDHDGLRAPHRAPRNAQRCPTPPDGDTHEQADTVPGTTHHANRAVIAHHSQRPPGLRDRSVGHGTTIASASAHRSRHTSDERYDGHTQEQRATSPLSRALDHRQRSRPRRRSLANVPPALAVACTALRPRAPSCPARPR